MSENIENAIAEGINAGIDEITQAQDNARSLIEGFELLAALSAEAVNSQQASLTFHFNKVVRDGSSDVVLTTNIQNGGSGTFGNTYNHAAKSGCLEVTVYADGAITKDGFTVQDKIIEDQKMRNLTNDEKTADVLKQVAHQAVLYKMLPSPKL